MIGTIGSGITEIARRSVDTRASASTGQDFQALVDSAGKPAAAAPGKTYRASVDSDTKLRDALAAFRKEATMTPAERARRDVLEKMDLIEDAIEAMTPEQRQATEDKIAAEVARRLRMKDAAPTQF